MKARLAPSPSGSPHIGEAPALARIVLVAPAVSLPDERPTLERFRELRERGNATLDKRAAKELIRELKAVGGHLRAVRLALTGVESGPELWAVVAALPLGETLRRVDAAL